MNIELMQAEATLTDFIRSFGELAEGTTDQDFSKEDLKNLINLLSAIKVVYLAQRQINELVGLIGED